MNYKRNLWPNTVSKLTVQILTSSPFIPLVEGDKGGGMLRLVQPPFPCLWLKFCVYNRKIKSNIFFGIRLNNGGTQRMKNMRHSLIKKKAELIDLFVDNYLKIRKRYSLLRVSEEPRPQGGAS